MRLLLIEDDPETTRYLERGLTEHGFQMDSADDGAKGLEMALTGQYDLLVLDVRLPRMDGFEVLKRLRARHRDVPVLILSAQGEVHSRIEGLNLGADDYLAKPFALAELVARIRSIQRRRHPGIAEETVCVADFRLDRAARCAWRGERRIELTQKEFQLVDFLARNLGHVVSRTMITENVWGYGFDSYSNTVDVHINRLRRKIDREFKPKLIHTVKGLGYIFEDRSAPAPSGPAAGEPGPTS